MMSLIRRRVLGLMGAVVGGVFVLTACGGAPAPAPRPPAAHYDASVLELSLDNAVASDGTTILKSDCTPSALHSDGSGTYQCSITYSDMSTISTKVTLDADGTFHVTGQDTPTQAPPTTSVAPVDVLNAFKLQDSIRATTLPNGSVPFSVFCQPDQPTIVPATGAGTYLCTITDSDNVVSDTTIVLSADSTWHNTD